MLSSRIQTPHLGIVTSAQAQAQAHDDSNINFSGEKQNMLSNRNQAPDLCSLTSVKAKAQAPEENIRQDQVLY